MPPSPKSLPNEECDHLGVLFKSGRYLELEDRTRVLLEQFPDSGLVWKALGAALQMQGKEALPFLQRAAELLPDDAATQCNLGGELRSLGQLDAAVSRFRRALEIRPDFAEAHNNLGAALQDLGHAKEAVASYVRALQINPGFALAHNNLGSSLQHLGQPADAVASFHRALEIDPDYADAHCNLARALGDLGQWADAAASYRRALEIKPDFVVAHNRLGVALRNLGQPDAAAASHRRALEIDPDHVSSHNNLGVALRDLGQFDAAMASCRRALELDPDFVPALNNLGVALEDHWQLDEAVACLRQASQLDPDSAALRSSLLSLQLYLVEASAESLLAETRQFGDLVARRVVVYTDWANAPDPERCLRIGFVSPDFRTHPVGYFIESILGALRSSAAGRLEIFAYTSNSHIDEVTDRIRSLCHAWHSAVGVADENLARQIRADGIDILIDLSGHTSGNRLSMFACKPAPVQVSWLGYMATTGLTAMDYLIADPWALPEAEEAHFTEKIWRLPETRLCFTAPNSDVQVSALPAIVNGYATFGCFQYQNKINDAVIALWARVLQAMPGSRLFLKTKQFGIADVRQRIADRFAANGIDAGRLIFEGSSPRGEYLASYHRVDIVLDPFPFPGGTTTAESLWMGVPVLTLAGERFHERQGVGLLMNAGLPDWIAADENDYVARAVSHAGDLPRLAALRKDLRNKVLDSPLFDAPRFAGHFEAALRGMWQAWCCGKAGTTKQQTEANPMKTFLHVGCGSSHKDLTTRGFNTPEWNELRLDIDPNAAPDIVGTMLDMSAVADGEVDALFSSHNIEHLYAHEVPLALAEFRRVLKPDGFAVITCPDLQSVCQLIADDKLTEPAYISPAGPIAPLDILYGLRSSLQQGNLYMAHRCGFTEKVLVAALQDAGFCGVVSGSRGHPFYDLWAVASKAAQSQDELDLLAEAHFPE